MSDEQEQQSQEQQLPQSDPAPVPEAPVVEAPAPVVGDEAPASSGPESEGEGDDVPVANAPSAAEAAPPAALGESVQRAAEAAGELPQPLQRHLEAQVQEGGITRMNAAKESARLGEAIDFSMDAIHAFVHRLLHARQAGG